MTARAGRRGQRRGIREGREGVAAEKAGAKMLSARPLPGPARTARAE